MRNRKCGRGRWGQGLSDSLAQEVTVPRLEGAGQAENRKSAGKVYFRVDTQRMFIERSEMSS